MTGTTLESVVRNTTDCQQRWFYGGSVQTWLLTGEDTDGTFFLFDHVMEGGKPTPLHTHPADETMYVAEGAIKMHLDGVETVVTSGGVAFAPRGVPHAFLVVSETARVLCLHTPATCEGFYLAASEPLMPSTDRVVDFGRVGAAAQAAGGIELLGPPPFVVG